MPANSQSMKMLQGQPIAEQIDKAVLKEHLQIQHENAEVQLSLLYAQIKALA